MKALEITVLVSQVILEGEATGLGDYGQWLSEKFIRCHIDLQHLP